MTYIYMTLWGNFLKKLKNQITDFRKCIFDKLFCNIHMIKTYKTHIIYIYIYIYINNYIIYNIYMLYVYAHMYIWYIIASLPLFLQNNNISFPGTLTWSFLLLFWLQTNTNIHSQSYVSVIITQISTWKVSFRTKFV